LVVIVKRGEAVTCPKCKGTGIYRQLGKCFTCLGSGVMNYRDWKRCQAYCDRQPIPRQRTLL
jgi:DnaJ-class molecular chaperone